MVKMIGYARVSTLVQTEGHSIDYQKESIQKYCQLHDIELVKLYKDEGFSAIKEIPLIYECQR
jgi:DNA invertase Pin-like site-specific DNA recombinase